MVDLLQNDLSKYCQPIGRCAKVVCRQSFPAVHHLVSTVVGQLNPHSDTFHLWGGAFQGARSPARPKFAQWRSSKSLNLIVEMRIAVPLDSYQ